MELDHRSGFYHKGLSTGSVTIAASDYTKRAQHWINDSEYDRFLHIYNYRLKRKEKNKSREEIFYQMKVFFVKISCKFV